MISNRRILILYNSVSYFIPLIESTGVRCSTAFRQLNLIEKIVRKLSIFLHMPKHYWFGDWKKELNNIETVICFSTNDIDAFEYIKKKNPKIRLIFWYWDPVYRNKVQPNDISDTLCEKWSFDINDCKNYNMIYNTTFYFDKILLPEINLKYDAVFVGQDKGRGTIINDLKLNLVNLNLKLFFHIVEDIDSLTNPRRNRPILYSDYLNILSTSSAIIDIIQSGQNGISLRPMESIFLKKKLITNDKNIINADFYDSNNIFILDVDDIDIIHNFLKSPYNDVPVEIISNYNFDNWLNRFFNEHQ
ncbi:hypothetical protein [Flavobacterium hydrophilum]|uniref:Lipopolysaccharide biosynthesis protein n=1 Tax=Flavobacterium hydrophilum TaxID=2211445 RepID=A0A2V4BYJ6_9FLAO|nr:hypothetical protein [Flavobacterium hydrophilum]PXY44055.1 hypothetical protein DMB68_16575 [Flavobacterium hydrophilum]